MHHNESKLQIQCVAWFAIQYPHLRMLLYHPKNEGGHGRTQGAISKAEGVVAGVADLILQLPSDGYSCLAVELKTPSGRQSRSQQLFQLYFEAAGGRYIVARSLPQFKDIVCRYLQGVSLNTLTTLRDLYQGQRQAEQDLARERLLQIIRADTIE